MTEFWYKLDGGFWAENCFLLEQQIARKINGFSNSSILVSRLRSVQNGP